MPAFAAACLELEDNRAQAVIALAHLLKNILIRFGIDDGHAAIAVCPSCLDIGIVNLRLDSRTVKVQKPSAFTGRKALFIEIPDVIRGIILHPNGTNGAAHQRESQPSAEQLHGGVNWRVGDNGIHVQLDFTPGIIIVVCDIPRFLGAGAGMAMYSGARVAFYLFRTALEKTLLYRII